MPIINDNQISFDPTEQLENYIRKANNCTNGNDRVRKLKQKGNEAIQNIARYMTEHQQDNHQNYLYDEEYRLLFSTALHTFGCLFSSIMKPNIDNIQDAINCFILAQLTGCSNAEYCFRIAKIYHYMPLGYDPLKIKRHTEITPCSPHKIKKEIKKQYQLSAEKQYLKAAQAGHGEAMYLLGRLYSESDHYENKPIEAVKWFEAAAEHGYRKEAYYKLAVMYDSSCKIYGKGEVPKDDAKALQLYLQSYNLGHTIFTGTGIFFLGKKQQFVPDTIEDCKALQASISEPLKRLQHHQNIPQEKEDYHLVMRWLENINTRAQELTLLNRFLNGNVVLSTVAPENNDVPKIKCPLFL